MKHLLFLLPVLVPILCLGLPAGFFIAYALRLRRQRAQPPGPLTCGEVRSRLHAANLSLADRNEIARQFEGQRVRWAATFTEMFRTRGSWSVLCHGEGQGGQFFFDPASADRGPLERMTPGTRLVVEGTVRINLNHDLVTLESAVVRFDLQLSARAN